MLIISCRLVIYLTIPALQCSNRNVPLTILCYMALFGTVAAHSSQCEYLLVVDTDTFNYIRVNFVIVIAYFFLLYNKSVYILLNLCSKIPEFLNIYPMVFLFKNLSQLRRKWWENYSFSFHESYFLFSLSYFLLQRLCTIGG